MNLCDMVDRSMDKISILPYEGSRSSEIWENRDDMNLHSWVTEYWDDFPCWTMPGSSWLFRLSAGYAKEVRQWGLINS